MQDMQSSANGSLEDHGQNTSSSSLDDTNRALKPTKSISLHRGSTMATGDPAGNDIELWQASACTEFASDDEGIAARLLRACIDSITHLLLSTPHDSTCKPLRRSLSILKLWSMGHGAWDGRLDSMLERSMDLRRTTLSILTPLCRALNNGVHKYANLDDPVTIQLQKHNSQIYSQTTWLLRETDGNISDSESDGYSSSDNDISVPTKQDGGLDRLAEDVKVHVQCLNDLSNALESPAIDPKPNDEPSVLKVEQRAAHDYHVDLVTAKFPKAQTELAESLGKISWDRYQRMQNEREINTHSTAGHPAKEGMVASAQKSHVADSEFKDSGLGTSLPAPLTRYAETVVSFMTSIARGKRVQIPPLPQEAKSGSQFECNACGRLVRAVNNREWRKHLYLDLQPYTCLFVGCAFSVQPFADRHLWSNHLELDHQLGPDWRSITCPLCLESTDSGKTRMLIHFARHMEDIALAALPREVESEDEPETGTDKSSHQSFGNSPLSTTDRGVSNEQEEDTATANNLAYEQARPYASKTVDEQLNDIVKDLQREQPNTHINVLRTLARAQLKSEWGRKRSRSNRPDSDRPTGLEVRDLWERGSSQVLGTDSNETHPLMIGTDFAMCRCKLYKLEKNEWVDLGTGFVNIVDVGFAHWNIVVWSEAEHESQMLLSAPLSQDDGHQRQQDTLIVWTAQDGTDLALSFQGPEGCSIIWGVINEVVNGGAIHGQLVEFGNDLDKGSSNAVDGLHRWLSVDLRSTHSDEPYKSAPTPEPATCQGAMAADNSDDDNEALRTEVKRLRQDNEGKEMRERQLVQAIMALQQVPGDYGPAPSPEPVVGLELLGAGNSDREHKTLQNEVTHLKERGIAKDRRLHQLEQAVMALRQETRKESALNSSNGEGDPRTKLETDNLLPPPGPERSPSIGSSKGQTSDSTRQSQLAKEASQWPTFRCKTSDCEYSARGFGTQAALDSHIAQMHGPIENPLQFALDAMGEFLNIDPHTGEPKIDPNATKQESSVHDRGKHAEWTPPPLESQRPAATPSPTSDLGRVNYKMDKNTNKLAPSSTEGMQGLIPRGRKKGLTAEHRTHADNNRPTSANTFNQDFVRPKELAQFLSAPEPATLGPADLPLAPLTVNDISAIMTTEALPSWASEKRLEPGPRNDNIIGEPLQTGVTTDFGRPSAAALSEAERSVPLSASSGPTSCNFCRRRKKKCDGKKPDCTICERRGIECDYRPWQSYIERKGRTGESDADTSFKPAARTVSPKDLITDAFGSPPQSAAFTNLITPDVDELPLSSSTLSKLAKSRTKAGCITCRKRKKKCDERKPFCLVCQKNNNHCEGYMPVRASNSIEDEWARLSTSARVTASNNKSLPLPPAGIQPDNAHVGQTDHMNIGWSQETGLPSLYQAQRVQDFAMPVKGKSAELFPPSRLQQSVLMSERPDTDTATSPANPDASPFAQDRLERAPELQDMTNVIDNDLLGLVSEERQPPPGNTNPGPYHASHAPTFQNKSTLFDHDWFSLFPEEEQLKPSDTNLGPFATSKSLPPTLSSQSVEPSGRSSTSLPVPNSSSKSRRRKPLPPITVDPNDKAALKRARNTLAARESRRRKAEKLASASVDKNLEP
ncbi:hypothetical protein DE146DRAFT_504063 [Phaeosphaeria sp. MPI-PUGE-AT-0046c]|nr:hypothetical protein DE146DRAFT_504063 [Phaeosphaeria sp. MPI-PUGE-AT-0046c]